MESQKPIAFLSYAHIDDERGHITTLRNLLADEMQLQTTKEFDIFQDRKSILWGQNWKECVVDSLNTATFLIAIITPNFFVSKYCREELWLFLNREKQLGKKSFILPIYLITSPPMDDQHSDEIAQIIKMHQFIDLRKLRFRLSSPEAGELFAHLVEQIQDTLNDSALLQNPPPSNSAFHSFLGVKSNSKFSISLSSVIIRSGQILKNGSSFTSITDETLISCAEYDAALALRNRLKETSSIYFDSTRIEIKEAPPGAVSLRNAHLLMGSSLYNELSGAYIKRLKSGVIFDWRTSGVDVATRGAEISTLKIVLQGKEYGKEKDTDYAIIARTFSNDYSITICAGIGSGGTVSSLGYLIENYEIIQKKVSDEEEYFLLIKFNRISQALQGKYQAVEVIYSEPASLKSIL